MNELNSKLDRKDNSTQYKPRIHPGRNRGCGQRQNRYGSRDRSYSRERGPYNSGRNRRNYQNNNNYGNGSYRPRDGDYQSNRHNDRSNYRRQNSNQNYGQRNRNRSISRECKRFRPRYRSTSRENSVNRYRTNQSRSGGRQRSRTTSREREIRSRSRYFGSTSYLYQRKPMGLNISPTVWQSYINATLSCLSSRKYCEVIMDDLLLFTPNKQSHFEKLEDLLKALCKHGLKISPMKCHLFITELQYMGNTIFIEDRHVHVKPLRSRLEEIQKLKLPVTPKGCKHFAGMVNFVSMFCPELQKLLKPIYDLTKKGKPFLWEKEQQKAFKEIKRRMQNPPVLSMPNRKGRFILYSDTSKLATGSTLYQYQDGKPRLVAYASKRIPEAAKKYSITEVEMCGLAINIATFSHLLKRVDFDAVVDHLAIMHIMKSKMEPATNRIKRLLEVLSSYSFNLYYIKGKDMVLSDYLSRQMGDKSDLHQIIPI